MSTLKEFNHKMTKITWNEIVHNKYIVIDNKVYDVKDFKDRHPGGSFVFDEYYCEDASEVFISVGHSDYAREMMKEFCIGELDGDSRKGKKTSSSKVLIYSIIAGIASILCALLIIWYK